MSRINVEFQALTDVRFRIVGAHLNPLGLATHEIVETAFGLYLSMKLWVYCTQRGLLEVHRRDVDAIYPGLADAMIDAELLERVPQSRNKLRVRGGDGRLDWLAKKRQSGLEHGPKGKEYGHLGGRPKKPGDPVLENPVTGYENNPPLALALSLAPVSSEKTNTLSIPPPAPLVVLTGGNGGNPDRAKPRKKPEPDPVTLKRFQKFWNDFYPKRVCKQAALKAFLKLNPDPETLTAMVADISKRIASGEWLPDDEERRKFIPNCSTYLNQRRWEDEQ